MKVRLAVMSLHKCGLERAEKQSFTLSHSAVKLDLQTNSLANKPQTQEDWSPAASVDSLRTEQRQVRNWDWKLNS